MTESFYDVLGVAEDATTDEIETAYRERLKETHPDVSDDEDAGQETKTLIEARDVLVDEDERAQYDRVGHEAYVSDGPVPSADEGTADGSHGDTASDDEDSATGTGGAGSETARTGGGQTGNRTRREQRARERVRQERRRARDARQERREAAETGADDAGASASTSNSTTGTATDRDTGSGAARRTAAERRAAATDTTSATATEQTYSVREDVATTTSHGPLFPKGQQLTLLGIFFALYPVLLFSALLPAFPSFVNLVLSVCTLLTIIYLQSMPRVALLLFGGWSGISIVGLAVFGIGYFSAVGLVVLAGTVLPFGFSVLTASALRY